MPAWSPSTPDISCLSTSLKTSPLRWRSSSLSPQPPEPASLSYTSPRPQIPAFSEAFLRTTLVALAAALALAAPLALAQEHPKPAPAAPEKSDHPAVHETLPVIPPDSTTDGSVSVEGKTIAYRAVAGILTVGSSDDQDTQLSLDGHYLPGYAEDLPAKLSDQPAIARMYYVAYFMKDAPKNRPITFLYNGGPGSSTMYLHMGAFGPMRIVVPPDAQRQE